MFASVDDVMTLGGHPDVIKYLSYLRYFHTSEMRSCDINYYHLLGTPCDFVDVTILHDLDIT